jgi:hypothetical protein
MVTRATDRRGKYCLRIHFHYGVEVDLWCNTDLEDIVQIGVKVLYLLKTVAAPPVLMDTQTGKTRAMRFMPSPQSRGLGVTPPPVSNAVLETEKLLLTIWKYMRDDVEGQINQGSLYYLDDIPDDVKKHAGYWTRHLDNWGIGRAVSSAHERVRAELIRLFNNGELLDVVENINR